MVRRTTSQTPSRAASPPGDDLDERPYFDSVDELQSHGINVQDILKLKAAAINTVSGVNMTTRRQMLKIKVRIVFQCVVGNRDVSSQGMSEAKEAAHKILDGENPTSAYHECHSTTAPDMGGASGKVAYIDTEGTFRPDRIRSIADRFGVDGDMALENILYARAHNSEHQMELINECSIRFAEDKDFRLLIVDSIMALFRADYSGRGELSERQQKISILITNQVQSDPGATMTFVAGGALKPIGGHILSHASATRLYLRKGRAEERVAKLVDSPDKPESEASYKLDEGGWADV
ncbi:Rad51-domain-containing protein [Daedaleopsis nitida]|nr:Rad51-domain-containing protein [Daedaleopsis nitida]